MIESKSEASRLLGLRLRERRLALGFNQESVALLAGLNVSNYARIDRGHGNPTMYTLVRLAAVLQLELSELLTGLAVEHLPPTRDSYIAIDFRRSQKVTANRGLDSGLDSGQVAGLTP